MWVYHDASVPEHVLGAFTPLSGSCAGCASTRDCSLAGYVLALSRGKRAARRKVQFRDADSLISSREAQWVQLWLESPQPFHVFRDWYSHLDLMLAGMWARMRRFGGMSEWIEAHLKTKVELHPTHADQVFGRSNLAENRTLLFLVHDTVHDLPFATPIDSPRPAMSGGSALGGFNAKQITVTLSAPATEYRSYL